jgi:hypothetical protein
MAVSGVGKVSVLEWEKKLCAETSENPGCYPLVRKTPPFRGDMRTAS